MVLLGSIDGIDMDFVKIASTHARRSGNYQFHDRVAHQSRDFAPPHRAPTTPIFGHSLSIGHREHCGNLGWQMVWPNATSNPLYSSQWRRGRISRSAASVFSGFAVRTRPHRFEIRWT